jgi:hypothetical protein
MPPLPCDTAKSAPQNPYQNSLYDTQVNKILPVFILRGSTIIRTINILRMLEFIKKETAYFALKQMHSNSVIFLN